MLNLVTSHRASLIEQVLDAQDRLMRALQRGAQPAWLDLDLTMMQLKALLVLHQARAMAVGQLGAALHIGRPAATLLVDALVRLALAERVEDEADRRRTLVSLTPRARDLVGQLYQGHRDRLEALLARLDDAQLAELSHGISALADAALEAPETASH